MRRIVLVLVVGLLVAFGLGGVARAHTDLSSLDVQAGDDPGSGPELVLAFSGPLDQAFSKVRVLDMQGAEVDPGPGAIDPADASVLRLLLGSLQAGDYQAAWRVRSVDGHVLEGTDPFTLAADVALTTTTTAPATTTTTAATTTTAPTPSSTTSSTTEPPATTTTATGGGGSGGTDGGGSGSTRSENTALLEAPLRWLNYLAAALVVGTAMFVLVVWRPVSPPGSPGAPRMLARVGALVLLAANLVLIVVQAAYAAGVGLGSAMGQPLVDVLGTRTGWDWMARIVLIGVLVGVTWSLRPGMDRLRWGAVLALGAAVMLSFSLVSHAATAWAPPLSIAVDWVHLLAMGVWLGGLPALGLALLDLRRDAGAPTTAGRAVATGDASLSEESETGERHQGMTVAGLVGRFSAVAVTCVALLVVTGTYNLMVHLDGLGSLLSSGWGQALVVKLLLFGVLLVFGAVNKFRLLPSANEAAGGDEAGVAAPFLRTVPSEVVVGAVLLLVVGIMTSLAPM